MNIQKRSPEQVYEIAVKMIQACGDQLERTRRQRLELLQDGEHVLVIVDPDTEFGTLMLESFGIEHPNVTFDRMLEFVNAGVRIDFHAGLVTLIARIEGLPGELHEAIRRPAPFGCHTVVLFADVAIVSAWDPRQPATQVAN